MLTLTDARGRVLTLTDPRASSTYTSTFAFYTFKHLHIHSAFYHRPRTKRVLGAEVYCQGWTLKGEAGEYIRHLRNTKKERKIEQHHIKCNTIISVGFKLLYSHHICGNVHFLSRCQIFGPKCTFVLTYRKHDDRSDEWPMIDWHNMTRRHPAAESKTSWEWSGRSGIWILISRLIWIRIWINLEILIRISDHLV